MKANEISRTDRMGLRPGLYVTKREAIGNQTITTFDLRFTHSDEKIPITQETLDIIGTVGNLYLKKLSSYGDDVIYFGHIGSDTRLRLIMRGLLASEDIAGVITKMCDFIFMNNGQISENHERKNCTKEKLDEVKLCVIEYSDMLRHNPRYEYSA